MHLGSTNHSCTDNSRTNPAPDNNNIVAVEIDTTPT
jgi:hypothetical protein